MKATAVSYNEIELVWDPPFPAPPTPLIYLMFWGTNPEDLIEVSEVQSIKGLLKVCMSRALH